MFRLRHLSMLMAVVATSAAAGSAFATGPATQKIQDRLPGVVALVPATPGLAQPAAGARSAKQDRLVVAAHHDEAALREAQRTVTVETRIGSNMSSLLRVPSTGVAAR